MEITSLESLHEAAHCCAAFSLDIPILHAQIGHDPHVRTGEIMAFDSVSAALEALVIIDLAPTLFDHANTAIGLDEANAFRRCQRLVLQEQYFDEVYTGLYEATIARREGLRREAHRIVRSYRNELRAVAAALERHKSLSGAEIEDIIVWGSLKAKRMAFDKMKFRFQTKRERDEFWGRTRIAR